MQKIYTKLFRLDGNQQLGMLYLKGDMLNQFKKLAGFRYCPDIKLWHIDYYVDCITYLNQRYSDRYVFIADHTALGKIPILKSNQEKHLKLQVSMSDNSERMYVKHSYHRGLFKAMQIIEGAYFNRTKGYWVMLRKGKSYDYVKKAAEDYGFTFEINDQKLASSEMEESECESDRSVKLPIRLGSVEQGLLRTFEQELRLKNRSPRTMESYLFYARQFLLGFNGQDLARLDIQEIREYFNNLLIKRNYSYSSINLHISAVRGLLSANFQRDLPGIEIPRPKSAKALPKVLTKEEIQSMLESSYNDKHRLIISMLYSTGMRRAEVIGLKVTDIDLLANRIRIHGKGNKDRIAFISLTLRKQLLLYLKSRKPVEYLFEGQRGGRYSESSIEKVIKDTARRAGIEKRVTPHMLRHSFATHLISAGVGLPHVQKLLGHTNIKTTMIYTHIADNDLQNLPNPLDDMDL